MTDEARLKALMLRGLGGDAAAHGELLSAMSRYLRGYFARRIGSGAADLEDLVQDTLLAIHLKRGSYDPSQPFTPWAYAVARYKLIDHFRRGGVRKTVPLEDAGELLAAETVEEGAVRRDLNKLLDTLPPRQRQVMVDVKLAGHSIEEAGQRAGMSISAVKVTIHRGLKALGKRVRDED
ncbi:MAG TPA: sigma-70 family RNA polymerase sigma factor [Caulobacteraceae bacterium]